MHIKSRTLSIIVMLGLVFGLLLGVLVTPGIAAQDGTDETVLPRDFQGARLGMSLSDFVAIVPEANRISRGGHDPMQRTVVVPSKDRYLQRMEYRFYKNRLRELVIYYKADKVPGGYERLLERLSESYGKSLGTDLRIIEDGRGSYATLVKKTSWKDRATMASLIESHKITEERGDLMLTITDLGLQQAFEQDQEHRRRQRELSIPLPLPDQTIQKRQATILHLDHARTGQVSG